MARSRRSKVHYERYAREAREKIAEYLRLAAEGSNKTKREVNSDADLIVDDLLEGAVQLVEKEESDKAKRRYLQGQR